MLAFKLLNPCGCNSLFQKGEEPWDSKAHLSLRSHCCMFPDALCKGFDDSDKRKGEQAW